MPIKTLLYKLEKYSRRQAAGGEGVERYTDKVEFYEQKVQEYTQKLQELGFSDQDIHNEYARQTGGGWFSWNKTTADWGRSLKGTVKIDWEKLCTSTDKQCLDYYSTRAKERLDNLKDKASIISTIQMDMRDLDLAGDDLHQNIIDAESNYIRSYKKNLGTINENITNLTKAFTSDGGTGLIRHALKKMPENFKFNHSKITGASTKGTRKVIDKFLREISYKIETSLRQIQLAVEARMKKCTNKNNTIFTDKIGDVLKTLDTLQNDTYNNAWKLIKAHPTKKQLNETIKTINSAVKTCTLKSDTANRSSQEAP